MIVLLHVVLSDSSIFYINYKLAEILQPRIVGKVVFHIFELPTSGEPYSLII